MGNIKVVIEETTNGWLVKALDCEGSEMIYVYEDLEGTEASRAEAFNRLLFEHFPHVFASKKKAGLDIKLLEEGWGQV
jgi:hypothetical protein